MFSVIDHTRLSRVGAVLVVVDADAAVVRVILDQIILADAGSVELVLDESCQQVVRNLSNDCRLKTELSDLGSNIELSAAKVLHQRIALCKSSVDRRGKPE